MSPGNPYLDNLGAALDFADLLERRADSIKEVLCRFETLETAEDELVRSVDTFRNLHRELHYLRAGTVESMSIFLPINLPLYSLVLFACVPSLMAHEVTVRGPAATPEWLDEVAEVTLMKEYFPRVHVVTQTRRQFLDRHVIGSDVIVFTGRFENAEAVRCEAPSSTFIYEGSGINPIIIGPRADITDEVLEKVLAARLFNSGQDCAGPDVVCVHVSRQDEFIDRLSSALDGTCVGDLGDPQARVSKILNRQPLKGVAAELELLEDRIVYGGSLDIENQILEPTIILRDLAAIEPFEWFSPVFNVGTYESSTELRDWFERPAYRDYAMYASLFGESAFPALYESSTVLDGCTILDVEQGNIAYGGNGRKSNYVAHNDAMRVGPILISESLAATQLRR